ncbi:hypothetical protein WJR50_30190 [Catalinimonas sp. 4WD22]
MFNDSAGRMEGTGVELILNASDVVIIPLIASPIESGTLQKGPEHR